MDPKSLDDYIYTPLKDPEREIRLIELFPGDSDDDNLRVKFHYAALVKPAKNQGTSLELAKIQSMLPPGWTALKDLEDRYIFRSEDGDQITRNHPDASVPSSIYDSTPQLAYSDASYEALSYSWGVVQETQFRLLVVEQDVETLPRKFDVAHALGGRNMHQPGRRTRESHQVRHVPEVYTMADQVVVWLGPAPENSGLALSTLEYLGKQFEFIPQLRAPLRSPDAEMKYWWKPNCKLPYGQNTWDAIEAFLARTWFGQLWVVQEIQLANPQSGATVYCGHDTIPWRFLARAIICLYYKHNIPAKLKEQVSDSGIPVERMADMVLRKVLYRVSINKACTDDRDRIYGVLGIAPTKFANRIQPDYSHTTLPTNVYKEAFLAHAEQVQRLELFCFCFSAPNDDNLTPSWLPKLNTTSPFRTYLGPQFAAGMSRAYFNYNKAVPNQLQVLGVRCAVVTRVTEHLSLDLNLDDSVRLVEKWKPRHNSVVYKPTGETMWTAFAHTLFEWTTKERYPKFPYQLETKLQEVLASALSGKRPVSHEVREALSVCRGRAFFETREGYVGLAPGDTKTGDLIAIILGCSQPLVLRPAGEQSRYRVIGECFVYGLQDASYLLGPLPRPWNATVHPDTGNRRKLVFSNGETGETTGNDPRLAPLKGWEGIDQLANGDDPEIYHFIRNKDSGEVVNFDRRIELDVLKTNGIDVVMLTLV